MWLAADPLNVFSSQINFVPQQVWNSPCLCNAISIFICHVDVIKALDQKLDAKWRKFGTFLYIEPAIMDRIEKDKSDVEDCMLQLVEDWVCNRDGTGDLHRTWKTVVQAVKEMKVPLPQKLEEQYGHLT